MHTFLAMKLINGGMDSFKKGTWSPEEDEKLSAYIKRYGIWNWSLMPKAAGLSRSGKSCRLRWMNYLKPSLKRECYSSEEIEKIIQLHKSLGNKWSKIAELLPGRTDNGIKNFWNTHLKSRCSSKSNKVKQPKQERVVRKHSSPLNGGMETVQTESKSSPSDSSLLGCPTPQSVSSSDGEISNSFDSFNDVNSQNIKMFDEHVEWGFLEDQSFNVSEFTFGSFNDDLNMFWLNNFVDAHEVGYDLW